MQTFGLRLKFRDPELGSLCLVSSSRTHPKVTLQTAASWIFAKAPGRGFYADGLKEKIVSSAQEAAKGAASELA